MIGDIAIVTFDFEVEKLQSLENDVTSVSGPRHCVSLGFVSPALATVMPSKTLMEVRNDR